MPRTSRGRQKIEMTKMTKESNLLVTFSKRRSGLFKKASELCTLCGAEITIIVFSPGKKVFSFGHPSVEELVDRYLSRRSIVGNNPNPNPNPLPDLLEAHRNLNARDLNMQLTNLLNHLEMEKKRTDELTKMRKESAERCWWEGPTEALDVHQLEQVKMALEELKKNVVLQSEKMQLEGQGASRGPYFMGAGPAGGGQAIVAFPPQVPQRGHTGVPFPPHVPPQDLNASELGLSLTPHGYAMGYSRGGQFG